MEVITLNSINFHNLCQAVSMYRIPDEAKFSRILSVSFVHWIEEGIKLSSLLILSRVHKKYEKTPDQSEQWTGQGMGKLGCPLRILVLFHFKWFDS